MVEPLATWKVDELGVRVYPNREAMGTAAAEELARFLATLPDTQSSVNLVFAAAPSQDEFLAALASRNDIDWGRVQAFHLDEYVGLPREAPQKFMNYLKDHIFDKVFPRKVYYIDTGEASPEAICRRYAELLQANPVDVACLGIGENGHIAFNDPSVADFEDPELVKIVNLDETSRRQQVHDGCFETLEEVPTHAITMTIPAIMSAKRIICVVPGPTKREAVRRTLLGPITTACPASILRRHPNATLFLDLEAAELVLDRLGGEDG